MTERETTHSSEDLLAAADYFEQRAKTCDLHKDHTLAQWHRDTAAHWRKQAAALAAPTQAPAQPVAPPTKEMIEAGVRVARDGDAALYGHEVADIYMAMQRVAAQAAPSAPEGFVMVPKSLAAALVAWSKQEAYSTSILAKEAAAFAASGQQEPQR